MKKRMKRIKKKTTLLVMLLGSNSIMYREVYVKELAEQVRVTTEEVFASCIKEGDLYDDLFYCYTPTDEFMTLNDHKFEEYVNRNF